VASLLHADLGLPLVGVPKTIDNDVVGTDVTFGFNTAVQIATDAIDRLHTTAESHDRVMVVEVMGRHSGWIATHAGIAGGATAILIPEQPFDIEQVCELLRSRHERGRYASIVVVAEGAEPKEGTMAGRDKVYDQYGHVRLGGMAETIAHAIEDRTGFETRMVLLGHIQRGGTPTAHDRVLATRYGVHACDMVAAGEFGKMASLQGNQVVSVPLSEATKQLKRVDPELFDVAQVFFG
jgi:6-phosphofructokinase 1